MKMNKKFSRVLTLALMLVMVVSLLPLSVSAHYTEIELGLFPEGANNHKMKDQPFLGMLEDVVSASKGFTVKAEDYDKYINPLWGDLKSVVFERVGMGDFTRTDKVANDIKAINVPAFPISGTYEEQEAWHNKYDVIFVNYVQHSHNLAGAPWCHDNNYHWRYCTECGQRAFLEWHSDKNEDGVCDFCDNPIHYYNVTLKDTTGGKVTLSKMKGAMNDRINVTVTPDAGYHLGEIHFYNNNEQHSELTRWERKVEEGYYFIVLNWDIEVEATFVKD